MWSLLPGFCTAPIDLSTAFTPDFARTLGTVLKEAGLEIRKIVCVSLKQLAVDVGKRSEQFSF